MNHWKYQWRCTPRHVGGSNKVLRDLRKLPSPSLNVPQCSSLPCALDVHCGARAPPLAADPAPHSTAAPPDARNITTAP